jgi:hypothetical protein
MFNAIHHILYIKVWLALIVWSVMLGLFLVVVQPIDFGDTPKIQMVQVIDRLFLHHFTETGAKIISPAPGS